MKAVKSNIILVYMQYFPNISYDLPLKKRGGARCAPSSRIREPAALRKLLTPTPKYITVFMDNQDRFIRASRGHT